MTRKCPICNGSGVGQEVVTLRDEGEIPIDIKEVTCYRCHGVGYVVRKDEKKSDEE
jgi:DnaJ-class molecular chaperone